jgi:predicted CopG family antitoxin
MDKVKVQLDKDVVKALFDLKNMGDTYSDVLRKLLEKK